MKVLASTFPLPVAFGRRAKILPWKISETGKETVKERSNSIIPHLIFRPSCSKILRLVGFGGNWWVLAGPLGKLLRITKFENH
jgi:hypothetical protein